MRKIVPLLLALSLTACGDDTRTAGGVTKGEAEALDDAAEMVEQARPPVDSVKPGPSAEPRAEPRAEPSG